MIDFKGVNFINLQGVDKMAEILDMAESHDIELRLARLKTEIATYLKQDGLSEHIGESRSFGNVYETAADLILES